MSSEVLSNIKLSKHGCAEFIDAQREPCTSDMLTPAVIVLVIWTSTDLASRFDRVGLAAVADHRNGLCVWVTDRRAASRENRHALGQCSFGPRFDFDTVFAFAIFVIHGFSLQERPARLAATRRAFFC
jgi:hypothetical protein